MADGFPPALHDRLSFLLGKLHLRGYDLETDALAPLGIDIKQHAVLCVLTDEGPMTQQELGGRIGIDRTTIVAVVDRLDDTGLVQRRRSPTDRRRYLLTVTAAGRRAQQRGQELVAGAERRLLAALDERERRTLTDLLARALTPDG